MKHTRVGLLFGLFLLSGMGCAARLPARGVQRTERVRVWVTEASTGRTVAKVEAYPLAQQVVGFGLDVPTLSLLLRSTGASEARLQSHVFLWLDGRGRQPVLRALATSLRDERELHSVFEQHSWQRIRAIDRYLRAPVRSMPLEVQQRIDVLVQQEREASFNAEHVAVVQTALPEQIPLRIEVEWES